MAARSIGTATISFGLVSVPVNLYSSSESKSSVSFNMLHKKCGTRLKQQYICPKDNNEVVGRVKTGGNPYAIAISNDGDRNDDDERESIRFHPWSGAVAEWTLDATRLRAIVVRR